MKRAVRTKRVKTTIYTDPRALQFMQRQARLRRYRTVGDWLDFVCDSLRLNGVFRIDGTPPMKRQTL